MLKNKWSFGLLALILLAGIGTWYFFIKEFDYNIKFESQAAPGSIALKLSSWEFQELEIIGKGKLHNQSNFVNEIKIENDIYELHWKFSPKDNSSTQVKIGVKNKQNFLSDRFRLLFGQPDFQKKMKEDILTFKEYLQTDADLYNITIENEIVSPETICACTSNKSHIEKKSIEMMKTINTLSAYVLDNALETAGRPRIKINSWNKENNHIQFDFCFPLAQRDTFPSYPNINIKKIPEQKSLKATYRGNYMFSHNAWMQMISYAEIHDIKLKNEVLEIFKDNPEMRGTGKHLRAEIFMPLKK